LGQIEELAGAERDEAGGRVHGHPQRRRNVELIKKGRRFRTRATVTKLEGKTAVLIHDVVEAI
jgi:hypothetical protein